MDRTEEQGGPSFWAAEVLERDEAGAPMRVRVSERIDDVEGQWARIKGLGESQADVEGQGWSNRGVGETEDDVEGQAYSWRGLRPADDDVEGQGYSYRGIGETEDDVEAQWARFRLAPVADTEGHVLVIGEGIPATERIQGRTFVVDDDVEGHRLRVP